MLGDDFMDNLNLWKDNLDNNIAVGDIVLCLTGIDKFKIKEVKTLSTKQDTLSAIQTVIFMDGGRLDAHNVLDLTVLGVNKGQINIANIRKPYFDAIGNPLHEYANVFYFPRLAYNGRISRIDKLTPKYCIIRNSRKAHNEVVSVTAIENAHIPYEEKSRYVEKYLVGLGMSYVDIIEAVADDTIEKSYCVIKQNPAITKNDFMSVMGIEEYEPPKRKLKTYKNVFTFKCDDYSAIHRYCTNNREALSKVKKCGCFYCCTIFNPAEIEEWVEQDNSAVCPHCGVDSVIPESDTGEYELTEDLLKEMYKVWFE